MAGLAADKSAGIRDGPRDRPMPTLFRFVVTLCVLTIIAYGAMFALVMFVEPKKAELTVRIPPEKLVLPQ